MSARSKRKYGADPPRAPTGHRHGPADDPIVDALEPTQQPLEILQLKLRPEAFPQSSAQLVEDFTRGLRINLIGQLDARAKVRPVTSLRSAKRVKRRIPSPRLAEARWHPAHHLFSH